MMATYGIKKVDDLARSFEEPTKNLLTAIATKIADGTLKGVQIIGEASFPAVADTRQTVRARTDTPKPRAN